MRARSGVAASLVPVAAASAMLAFSLVGARLFASSAASASFRDQISETCRSDSALQLPLPSDAAAVVDDLATRLVHVDRPTRGDVARVRIPTAGGPPRPLVVLHIGDVESHVQPPLAALGPGEIALSATNVTQLATELGGVIVTQSGAELRVAQVFDDVPSAPVPDYWCGWASVIEPTADGDPPPPSAIASAATVADLGGYSYDEYRVVSRPLTLTQAREARAAFDDVTEAWNARFSQEFGELPPNELRRVVERAEAVTVTVQRTLAPVLLTAVVAVTVVLVASAVLLARARQRELRLLAVRGVPPARIAIGVAGAAGAAVATGTVLGALLAYLGVRAFGPSSLLEPVAVRNGLASSAVASALAIPLVAAVVALVADRYVDRGRTRVGAGASVTAVVLGLAILAAVAFRRLDRDGGIRTFGVESRGGSLLALGFPLFALLALSAVAAAALAIAVVPMRLTGRSLPRALRLGWRRVVLERGTLTAIVVAVALAAGCVSTANALADAARRQLEQKAEVYVGADLAVTVYDTPEISETWRDRTSLAATLRARQDGEAFELVGVDVATFGAVARLRGDASATSLDGLLDAIRAPGDARPAPAIAVGSPAAVGDVVTVEVPGAHDALTLEVVATPDFFPGKTSGAVMFVVDRAVVESAVPFPVSVLYVRDPPEDAIAQLRGSGVRTGVVKDVDTAFDGSAYSALRWSYEPLAVLGALFACVALALQLLVVASRSTSRRATHAVMRRTGFGTRALLAASVVEAAVPFAVGTVLGVGGSVIATSLAVGRLDPMPTLQPPPLFEMPWTTVVGVALVLPVWSVLVGVVITRSTVRADPMEVLHGAL